MIAEGLSGPVSFVEDAPIRLIAKTSADVSGRNGPRLPHRTFNSRGWTSSAHPAIRLSLAMARSRNVFNPSFSRYIVEILMLRVEKRLTYCYVVENRYLRNIVEN